MKYTSILFVSFVLLSFCSFSQVGIGTTNPDASSALDITATDKGLLIPRITVADRIAIASPAEGLLVYQTDDVEGFYYYDSTQWVRLLDRQKDAIPTGAVFAFPTATAPTGYLVCDGSAVSRTTYSDLFALIGVMYGAGDGTTTFNLPDYRGKFLRGTDNGAGRDPDGATRTDRGDGTIGDEVGTNQTNMQSSHSHLVNPPNTVSDNGGLHNHYITGQNLTTNYTGNHFHGGSVSGSTNSSPGHNHVMSTRTVEVDGEDAFSASETIEHFGPDGIPSSQSTNYAPSHSHSFSGSLSTNYSGGHDHSVNIPSRYSNSGGTHSHTIDIPQFSSYATGGNENRPININVTWCIKF